MMIYQVLERIQPHAMGWPDPPPRSHGYFVARQGADAKKATLASRGIHSVDILPITVEDDGPERARRIARANQLLAGLAKDLAENPWLIEYLDATMPETMDKLRKFLRGET